MKNDLRGFTVGATDGDIGTVEECYFDDVSFTVRHLVIDTGGWLSGRKVLISPMSLRAIDWEGKRINAALTKAQVEKSPAIDTDRPVSRQHEIEYYSHYRYPLYWAGPYLWGAYPYPYLPPAPPSDEATSLERERHWEWAGEGGDPHLRGSAAISGYHIAAADGDLGHVEDFLIDDTTWSIRYLVVDTRNWWPGKKVLLAPEWIERVDWNDAKVHVGVTRDQIKKSPEYDPSSTPERDYETRLHDHYGRLSYWGDRRGDRTPR